MYGTAASVSLIKKRRCKCLPLDALLWTFAVFVSFVRFSDPEILMVSQSVKYEDEMRYAINYSHEGCYMLQYSFLYKILGIYWIENKLFLKSKLYQGNRWYSMCLAKFEWYCCCRNCFVVSLSELWDTCLPCKIKDFGNSSIQLGFLHALWKVGTWATTWRSLVWGRASLLLKGLEEVKNGGEHASTDSTCNLSPEIWYLVLSVLPFKLAQETCTKHLCMSR